MKVNRIEDLEVWVEGKNLAKEIYQEFGKHRDYGFKDQICRAAVSVSNNVAEGFERKGNREFKKFLYISKGSCGEVRSMLHLAQELNYIDKLAYEKLHDKTIFVSRKLGALINSLPNQ